MDLHPYCELFPAMPADDLARLAEDIRENGLREPVITYEGKILDGRNRLNAARLAEVEVEFKDYRGKDALAYVISRNLHRRHLTESQRAMIAAGLSSWKLGENQHSGGSANLPTLTQAKAAEQLKVSERTVRDAVKVKASGVPELVKAVEDGEVTASAAAEVAKLPKVKQKKIVAAGPAKVKEAAKEQRQGKGNKPDPEPDEPAEEDSDPLKAAADDYCRRVREMGRTLDDARRQGAELAKEKIGVRMHWQSILTHISNAKGSINAGIPAHKCPYCKATGKDESGAACKGCKGLGYLDRGAYKRGCEAVGVSDDSGEGDE